MAVLRLAKRSHSSEDPLASATPCAVHVRCLKKSPQRHGLSRRANPVIRSRSREPSIKRMGSPPARALPFFCIKRMRGATTTGPKKMSFIQEFMVGSGAARTDATWFIPSGRPLKFSLRGVPHISMRTFSATACPSTFCMNSGSREIRTFLQKTQSCWEGSAISRP